MADLGPPISVQRDSTLQPDAPRSAWHLRVVLRNTGPKPVYVAFQPGDGTIQYQSRHTIKPRGMVAMLVGTGDVKFLFLRTHSKHPLSLEPVLVDKIEDRELEDQYPGVPRR
jgi:hypothetical protein